MKKTKKLVIGIVLFLAFSLVKAQPNLQFSKVILVGKEETVPSGKVWKIVSCVVFNGVDSVAGSLIHPMDQAPVPLSNHMINLLDEGGNNLVVGSETGFVTMVPKAVYEKIMMEHVGIPVYLKNLPLYLSPLTTIACGKDALRITAIEFNIIANQKSEVRQKQPESQKSFAQTEVGGDTRDKQNEINKTNAAPTDKSTELPKSNNKPVLNSFSGEICDLIVFKNGDEIEGKVTEIGLEEIKFLKCENLEGPFISILKMEVFMIKHPNGTKDVFNSISSSNNENNNTNQSAVPPVNETVASLVNENPNLPAAKIISKYTKADIYKESNITWFGLDFSLFNLVYSKKTERDGELRGRISSLQKRYEKEIPQAKLCGWFSKTNLSSDKEYSESLYNIHLKQNWISNDYHDISSNEIQEHLKKYKSNGKGIGLVLIPEIFNEDKAKYTVEFVWFDIETKVIVHTQKISGRGKGGLAMASWDDALLEATKIYVDKYYKKEK